ncbi:SH3 domain-containing protein 2-like [Miscanthus floridulus]|uniref:SH3 domain-containing protein 2-like n=1 Tax=Miscanthus floridulus TaxID=154761 RepID=UPI00345A84A9
MRDEHHRGHGGGRTRRHVWLLDESENKLHQRMEKLYLSTRAAKHLQRDIVQGVDSYAVTGSKQVEIGNKLSDDSQKYGVKSTCTSGDTLSEAATYFAKARSQMEKECGNMLNAFGTKIIQPVFPKMLMAWPKPRRSHWLHMPHWLLFLWLHLQMSHRPIMLIIICSSGL